MFQLAELKNKISSPKNILKTVSTLNTVMQYLNTTKNLSFSESLRNKIKL